MSATVVPFPTKAAPRLKPVALGDVLAYLETAGHLLVALREFQWDDPATPEALADASKALGEAQRRMTGV